MMRMFSSVVAVAALSATAAMAQAPSNLVDVSQPSQAVSVSHVDFRDHQAVNAFYARLQGAARNVCAAQATLSTSAYFNCIDATVADAVRTVNRPTLTAVADQHNEALRTATGY